MFCRHDGDDLGFQFLVCISLRRILKSPGPVDGDEKILKQAGGDWAVIIIQAKFKLRLCRVTPVNEILAQVDKCSRDLQDPNRVLHPRKTCRMAFYYLGTIQRNEAMNQL
jgi:hypothetical protein